jgi:uncharacterized protein YceH (UPF0502 family)
MRKTLYVFLGLSIILSCTSKSTDIETLLKLTAQKINKMCPMTVDKDTQLDNVVILSNKTIQYNYTFVNWELEDLDLQAIESDFFPLLLERTKTNPGLKLFRENKVTVSYYYADMESKFVALYKVTPDLYLD